MKIGNKINRIKISCHQIVLGCIPIPVLIVYVIRMLAQLSARQKMSWRGKNGTGKYDLPNHLPKTISSVLILQPKVIKHTTNGQKLQWRLLLAIVPLLKRFSYSLPLLWGQLCRLHVIHGCKFNPLIYIFVSSSPSSHFLRTGGPCAVDFGKRKRKIQPTQ